MVIVARGVVIATSVYLFQTLEFAIFISNHHHISKSSGVVRGALALLVHVEVLIILSSNIVDTI